MAFGHNETAYPVLEQFDVEVKEQTDFASREFEIRQQLCFYELCESLCLLSELCVTQT